MESGVEAGELQSAWVLKLHFVDEGKRNRNMQRSEWGRSFQLP
jgi:hypothetical protein